MGNLIVEYMGAWLGLLKELSRRVVIIMIRIGVKIMYRVMIWIIVLGLVVNIRLLLLSHVVIVRLVHISYRLSL